jgi:hypothetical protein
MVYVAAVTLIMILAVPNYADIAVMRGLQFPMTALGEPPLQASRHCLLHPGHARPAAQGANAPH